MRVINKKIKAFTLAEMLVVLVISGIVISISLVVLSLVQQQAGLITKNYDLQTEKRLLERALWQDMNLYSMQFDPVNSSLKGYSEVDTITYTVAKNAILRNKDSLKLSLSKMTAYLDGIIVKQGPIDALELEISKNKGYLFVYKTNDATFYMND